MRWQQTGNGTVRRVAPSKSMSKRALASVHRDPQEIYHARKKEYRVRMARQYFLAKTVAPVSERIPLMPLNDDRSQKQHDVVRSAAFWGSSILLASAISYGVIQLLKWISTLIHAAR